jgi:integrase
MAVATLTDKKITSVKPPRSGRTELWDRLVPGLSLRVTERDARTWTVMVWTGPKGARKQRRIALGHPRGVDGEPVLSLKAARDAARAVKEDAAEGKPLTKRDRVEDDPAAANTFGAVAAAYLKQLGENERASTVKEATRVLLTHADLAKWQAMPIADITGDMVRALRDRIADRGAGIQSNRTLARLRAMFNWAIAEERIAASPAAGVKPRTGEEERDRVLTDAELRWFWTACGELGWPFGDIGKLLLLTAQRRDEVGEMRWSEVDLGRRTWVLPSHRAKNNQAHEVHLSDAAVDILHGIAEQRARVAMLKASDFVFTTTGTTGVSGYSRAKRRLDAAMLKAGGRAIPPFTLHDLRRTGATGMAKLKIPPHVVDKILNHVSGSIRGVAAIYNRHGYLDDRADALDAWSRFVMGLGLVAEERTNVVPMRA